MKNLNDCTVHAISPILLNIKQLGEYAGGLSRGRIYALMRDPTSGFPKQLKIGKTSRWRKADIDAWFAAQAAVQGLQNSEASQ